MSTLGPSVRLRGCVATDYQQVAAWWPRINRELASAPEQSHSPSLREISLKLRRGSWSAVPFNELRGHPTDA
jgi:hypothetical protein